MSHQTPCTADSSTFLMCHEQDGSVEIGARLEDIILLHIQLLHKMQQLDFL